jgi:lipopolysaccharide export system permease protein
MVGKVGLVLVAVAFIFGELITPRLAPVAEKIRLMGRGATVSSEFRSGMWTKDIIKSGGMTGEVQGTRFFNVREVRSDGQLMGVKLYDFDNRFRLRTLTFAETATFKGNNTWLLNGVTENSSAIRHCWQTARKPTWPTIMRRRPAQWRSGGMTARS